MNPNDLRSRVRAEIGGYIDRKLWDRAIAVEHAEVESLQAFHAEWNKSLGGRA